jgi:ribosomal protein RSM22 (predicted rRNA methylase)
MAEMSPELRTAVESLLAAESRGGLRAAAAGMSRQYRAGAASGSDLDLAAYLTVRLPATYAAVARVLQEVAERRPAFQPASLLDVGAGPGTASWAACARWPQLSDITMVDRHKGFLELAGRLAALAQHAGMTWSKRLSKDITSSEMDSGADLVIASYAMAEISAPAAASVAGALWRAARQMLVIVEPGTPAGFGRLAELRKSLLAQGAVPVAPCPHAGICPIEPPDWCHFSVRLPRRRAHLHAKQARVPFEDEKFAYLAVAREGVASGGARVLANPAASKPGIAFKLCTAEGLQHRQVARRDAASYRMLRKTEWGNLVGPEGGPS